MGLHRSLTSFPTPRPSGLPPGGQFGEKNINTDLEAAGVGVDNLVTYTVTFDVAGTYDLYGRVWVGPNSGGGATSVAGNVDDSFFIAPDFGATPDDCDNDDRVNNLNVEVTSLEQWEWVNLSKVVDSPTRTYTTSGGGETFIIAGREDGLFLDAFAFGTTIHLKTITPRAFQIGAML